MFMREKDFPTWKLGKLGELTGGGRGGGLTLIISVGEGGGLKLTFAKWEGECNVFTHFPTPLPVIITQSQMFAKCFFSTHPIKCLSCEEKILAELSIAVKY